MTGSDPATWAKPSNPSAIHPVRQSGRSISPVLAHEDPRAPPTYPFLAYATVKDRSEVTHSPVRTGPTGDLLRCAPNPAQNKNLNSAAPERQEVNPAVRCSGSAM